MRFGNRKGLTLVELIVAFTIMALLTAMAVPIARYKVRREREREVNALDLAWGDAGPDRGQGLVRRTVALR
ncbi:MAG: type II secretion system GspH family protein, partial [Bryobacteraceae bacterium]|nr:type II secretion system GspH family protein [Bryobacteraceae bacterium]